MGKVVLIGCTKSKDPNAKVAKDLYSTSVLFRLELEYADSLRCPVHIISAKYGFLNLDSPVSYYDETLNRYGKEKLRQWGEMVTGQLADKYDLDNTEFIILAGKKYYEYLKVNKNMPLGNTKIGDRLKQLKKLIGEEERA